MSKKVKAKWVVAIPDGAKVKVTVGQEVPADSDLLEYDDSGEKIINISAKIAGLSAGEKNGLIIKLEGAEINPGEIVYEKKGIFPKKIMLPVNGKVVKIDEFLNLHYKETGNKIKAVSCPVKAKVVKNDGKSLELEFRAVEYSGTGVSEGKAWGTAGTGYADDITELSVKDKGKIMLTLKLDQAWVFKAEVVGVKGIVVIGNSDEKKDDRINFRLPIIALEKSEWEELKKNIGEAKRAMINAPGGRLLLEV
jgi:hypothetical protein